MAISRERFNYNGSGYCGYLTCRGLELDSDGKGRNTGATVMDAIEVAALEESQISVYIVCWIC